MTNLEVLQNLTEFYTLDLRDDGIVINCNHVSCDDCKFNMEIDKFTECKLVDSISIEEATEIMKIHMPEQLI